MFGICHNTNRTLLVGVTDVLNTTHHNLIGGVFGAFPLQQVVGDCLAQRAVSADSCVFRKAIFRSETLRR